MMLMLLRRAGLLMLLLLLGTGCGTRDFDERLPVRLPPIPDGEVNRYQLTSPAGPFGTMVVELTTDWYGEIPVYMLELVSRTTTGMVETVDSSIVIMRQVGLRPVASFRFVRTGAALVTTAANYGEGSIAVSTWMHTGQDKQQLLPTDSRTYDTDQLAFLGRGLRLDQKRPTRVNVVEPMGPPPGGTVRPGEFRLLADEQVTVPAGSFNCRKVSLFIGDSEIHLWYEKAGTGRMVRSLAKESGIAMELLPSAPVELTPPQ